MKTGILCSTFRGDADFWRYAHKAYRKFAHGFAGLVLVVPPQDEAFFEWYRAYDLNVIYYPEDPKKGMLNHCVVISSADLFVPQDWDLVLILDSDCLFTAPVTPEDYMQDGKPVIWRERFADFKDSYPVRYNWKYCVQNALGINPEWETMVRHPMAHYHWLFKEFREAVSKHTGKEFSEYVLSGRNEFPDSFMAHDNLGAFALDRHPAKYHWIDAHLSPLLPCGWYEPYPGDKLRFFWSRGGMTKTVREEMEKILA
jgi:hypothetical protein